eukprot:2273212-Pyramimonas_sp.AAC.1
MNTRHGPRRNLTLGERCQRRPTRAPPEAAKLHGAPRRGQNAPAKEKNLVNSRSNAPNTASSGSRA